MPLSYVINIIVHFPRVNSDEYRRLKQLEPKVIIKCVSKHVFCISYFPRSVIFHAYGMAVINYTRNIDLTYAFRRDMILSHRGFANQLIDVTQFVSAISSISSKTA